MFWHTSKPFLHKNYNAMNIKTATKKIEDAIVSRKVLELSCIADDNDKRDFTVIPLCIKEYEGKQYLIATSRLDRWFAFDIDRITAMGEYCTYSTDRELNVEDITDKVFSEGEYIDGYYFARDKDDEPDPEALRDELKKIEADIKGLVGPRGNEYYIGLPDDLDREKMENLLSSRRHCLGMLFRKDPEGVKHFMKINRYLKDLTDRMYKRAAKIYRQYLSAGMDDGFDDDFMIDADLRFYYGGEEPIAILGDEEYYGSDFEYMLDVICEFCDKSPTGGASFTKSLRKTDRVEMSDKELDLYNSDDEMDWGELKIWIPELEGIKICHAVNEICVYDNGYSVPDLLRMNSFWREVKGIYQNIRNQEGVRI